MLNTQISGNSDDPRFERCPPRTLIIDDEPAFRTLLRKWLEPDGIPCDEATNGAAGLLAVENNRYDLVLLDVDMPEMRGPEVLRRLRERPPAPHLKVIMLSGGTPGDEMAAMLAAGADDYLRKPMSVVEFRERVRAVRRLKEAQDRSDLLNQRLQTVNQELAETLAARNSDLFSTRNALVLSLAEIVACRDAETGAHLLRLAHYSSILAEAAAKSPPFADQIEGPFLSLLECCAPLHDIGKVGIPDVILLKPGKLDPSERAIMERHTILAAEILTKVARRHPSSVAFLQMAIDIARHHHERFDGRGYPDGLMGDAIPLAARIVAIGDVYDALRSKRPYKEAMSHAQAVKIIVQDSPGHFDPALLPIFQQQCADQYEKLYEELVD